jgi:hypothetical protein
MLRHCGQSKTIKLTKTHVMQVLKFFMHVFMGRINAAPSATQMISHFIKLEYISDIVNDNGNI